MASLMLVLDSPAQVDQAALLQAVEAAESSIAPVLTLVIDSGRVYTLHKDAGPAANTGEWPPLQSSRMNALRAVCARAVCFARRTGSTSAILRFVGAPDAAPEQPVPPVAQRQAAALRRQLESWGIRVEVVCPPGSKPCSIVRELGCGAASGSIALLCPRCHAIRAVAEGTTVGDVLNRRPSCSCGC
jgi:hypothetical protein